MPPDSVHDTDAPLEIRLGRALGEYYEVRRLVGRGGFAEVFEVRDIELQRRLAVKVLRPDVAWTSGMLDRFRHEARAVARLNHPNILPIHFVGQGAGLVYYAMPFVEGRSLGDLLRSTAEFGVDRAVTIVRPVLEALQHAHERGLVHRDIKPDNIMIDVTTQRPLLVDFGIAKQIDQEKNLTQTGFVVGTPQYMSPEQALGESQLDARSDLYSIGAVLFQMVTGSPPFDGDTSQEIVAKHIAQPPPVPTAHNARIPKWLSDVIVRCLQKAPADRFQSAASMIQALDDGQGFSEGVSVSADDVVRKIQTDETELVPTSEQPGAKNDPGRITRKKLRAVPIIMTILLLGAAGAFGFVRFSRPSVAVQNHLYAPIRLAVSGLPESEVDAREEFAQKVARGGQLSIQWHLIRPMTPTGQPMGIELHGVDVMRESRGTVRIEATAQPGDSAFFTPFITNLTDQPLSVTANAGLIAAMSCDCQVPPGARREFIGYYPLFGNSTVRVEDPSGNWAMFRDLGSAVDRTSGSVSLSFESSDLAPPEGR